MRGETYLPTATASGIDCVGRARPLSVETTSGQATTPPEPRTPSVMIVDDDAATARMISLALREDGYVVSSACDGQDALGKLEPEVPDVIILDLEMPRMDGRSFYRELRARGLATPVVIVSAFDARSSQRELGADTYLAKPFDPDELLMKVRALLT